MSNPTASPWIDLYTQGDPQPRRFDTLETLHTYLARIERLSEDAILELTGSGSVEPPLTRRGYRVVRPFP